MDKISAAMAQVMAPPVLQPAEEAELTVIHGQQFQHKPQHQQII
jgi:hypothetical protein